jgi:hypothetical protein
MTQPLHNPFGCGSAFNIRNRSASRCDVGSCHGTTDRPETTEAAWTLRQQNDDALFRRVMPFIFIAMMLLLIASLFLLQGRSRIAMVAATVSALAVIMVTAGWEVYACQHPVITE